MIQKNKAGRKKHDPFAVFAVVPVLPFLDFLTFES
jgi:hypothetical protein